MSTTNNLPSRGVSCSSWAYGSFCPNNPGYFTQNRTKTKQENVIIHSDKRVLKEEEKIVTNDYLKNMRDLKIIKGEMKRNKSSSAFARKTNSGINQSGTQLSTSNNNILTTNKISTFKYQLSFDEWNAVKDKQQMIYREIQKLKNEEDEKFKRVKKKVDKKYQKLSEQKFQEWLLKKNSEEQKKKIELKQKRKAEEEKRKEDEERKKATMESWFQKQAKKMDEQERAIHEEKKRRKEEEARKEEEKKQKEKESAEMFELWKRQKDQELKERKKLERMMKKEKEDEKLKKKISKIHGITIGPYTGAGELREIQKLIEEKKIENSEEEDYYNEENKEEENEIKEKENNI